MTSPMFTAESHADEPLGQILSARRASFTHDPASKSMESPLRLADTRRKSMPVALTGLEAMSPTAAASPSKAFDLSQFEASLPTETIMEDISSVTIKARRVSIHAVDPSSNETPGSVTLKLRRRSTQTGTEPGLAGGVLSLSASSNNREQEIMTGPPTNTLKETPVISEALMEHPQMTVMDKEADGSNDGDHEEREELFFLENEWSFWFDETGKKQSLIELGSFNTVQGFWAYWNNLNVGIMRDNCNLSLFKKGTKPTRDDPMNCEGGRWVVSDLPKEQRVTYWSKMVMMMIGEQLDDNSDNIVCGAMFVTRESGDMMQLWVDGGYAVRTRGQEVVKPNLGQARQPMVEILQSLFPKNSRYRWIFYRAADPCSELDARRTVLKSDMGASNLRNRKECHYAEGATMMIMPEDPRGSMTLPRTLSSSVDFMVPGNCLPTSPRCQQPPYQRPPGLPRLSSLASDAFQPGFGHPMGNAIMSPECLSPGMPLSRESTTPLMDPNMGHEMDPAGLQMKLEEACCTMGATVDGQRRILQQKVVQISCLLSIFEQVQQNPTEIANKPLSDLIQMHLSHSYPGAQC